MTIIAVSASTAIGHETQGALNSATPWYPNAMSEVLVAHPSAPPLIMPLTEEQGASHQIQWTDEELVVDRRLAFQLAHLASQHHTSEYNKLKFGPQGCPTKYIPWSILSPKHAQNEKMLCAQNAVAKQAWWPACSAGPLSTEPVAESPVAHNQCQAQSSSASPEEKHFQESPQDIYVPISHYRNLSQSEKPVPPLNHPPALDLQRELSVAMSSPLSIINIPQLSSRIQLRKNEARLEAKTSETHPINISPIVPSELLPLITSHLDRRPSQSAYLFSLIPSLLLHRVVSHVRPSDIHRPYPFMRMANGNVPDTMNGIYTSQSALFSLYEASQPQSNGTLKPFPMINGDAQRSTLHLTNYPRSDTISPGNVDSPLPLDMPAASHMMQMLSPAQNRSRSAPPSIPQRLHVPNTITAGMGISPPPLSNIVCAISTDIISASIRSEMQFHPPKVFSNIRTDTSNTTPCNPPPCTLGFIQPALLPTLGNIFLSSCPGKKVRLGGPVKGRGAICRDLGHDLRRIRSLGVRCIICCLDDQELSFLGASWSDYYEIAQSLGIDVLRIPMPEGFAPPSPKQLDQYLSYIISSYTLQGIPVLVHCRGGVGRAGLIACCWMLKLGLCGWVDPNDDIIPPHTNENHEYYMVRRSTIVLVEKAISVVRRRRSVKAIETYEQVRFLVEFVEYMRAVNAALSL